jgi:hypothetical protein
MVTKRLKERKPLQQNAIVGGRLVRNGWSSRGQSAEFANVRAQVVLGKVPWVRYVNNYATYDSVVYCIMLVYDLDGNI